MHETTCLDCVRKHIGSAIAIMTEVLTGYYFYKWMAVGELVQAERECVCDYPELAEEIALAHRAIVNACTIQDMAEIDLVSLIFKASFLANDTFSTNLPESLNKKFSLIEQLSNKK